LTLIREKKGSSKSAGKKKKVKNKRDRLGHKRESRGYMSRETT